MAGKCRYDPNIPDKIKVGRVDLSRFSGDRAGLDASFQINIFGHPRVFGQFWCDLIGLR